MDIVRTRLQGVEIVTARVNRKWAGVDQAREPGKTQSQETA
jgi:hypothetical protein